jgi:hypothetical protein
MGLCRLGGGRSRVGLGEAVAQALFDAADPGATGWERAGQVEDQGLRGGAAGGEGSPEMSPTDFYAGAIAAFVVILLAKFLHASPTSAGIRGREQAGHGLVDRPLDLCERRLGSACCLLWLFWAFQLSTAMMAAPDGSPA